AAEHVVAAAELVRALDRDQVGGLLHDADHLGIPALVGADAADRSLGEVEADLAAPDALLDLPDRIGQRERLLVAAAQDVKREPLGGPPADARQARELCDQPL